MKIINHQKKYKELSGEIIDNIIKLYEKGYYLKHIGNEVNLNENKIKRVLLENNINIIRKSPPNKKIINEGIINEITNDYINGFSIRKISKKYDISYEVTRKTLIKCGVELRGYDYTKTKEHIEKIVNKRIGRFKGDNSPSYKLIPIEIKEEIIKLRNENKSVRFLMKKFGLGQKKIYEILNGN